MTLKAGLLALATTTALLAQEVKLNIPNQPAATTAPAATPVTAPAAAAPKYSNEVLAETFGWFMMARLGVSELQFNTSETEAFTRGVAAAIAGKEPPHDLSAVGQQMDGFIAARQEAEMERAKQRNYAAAATFFASLKGRPGIQTTPSGLCYEIVQPGTGPNAAATDKVKINYTGTLLNGQVFDSSEQHGEPLTIGVNEAIPGWAEGMQKINKGGKIKLYIPAELAYGDASPGGIPPASALIFDIEVLDINPADGAPAK
ncbi:MAG: FKBP-type peptidyl-prolyl cis-trans isomerase [Opitutaceae bacterium]|nr:FKBP-type peptidyl-prolyl cis-trans isomerase [Opitutaceae bacterium]